MYISPVSTIRNTYQTSRRKNTQLEVKSQLEAHGASNATARLNGLSDPQTPTESPSFAPVDKNDVKFPTELTYKDFATLLKSHKQVFLTGAGGVGKTYSVKQVLKHFIKPLIMAPTNQAAALLGGENGNTINHIFNFGRCKSFADLEAFDNERIAWYMRHLHMSQGTAVAKHIKKTQDMLKDVDLLVIDEVSMMSAQALDIIWKRLEQSGRTDIPILFVGDLFQLPPVTGREDSVPSEWVFRSKNWNPIIIELTKPQRTSNVEFAQFLQKLRTGLYTKSVEDYLLQLQNRTMPSDWEPTILCSHLKDVESINNAKLSSIPGEVHHFKGRFINHTGNSALDRSYLDFPADLNLYLKIGARVIITANDYSENPLYYNGLKGEVVNLTDNGVIVRTDNDNEVYLKAQRFDKKQTVVRNGKHVQELTRELTQIPVRLAYALTIHKSQGMSLSDVEVHANEIFEVGQFYVSLSRAVDPNKLKITGFSRDIVKMISKEVQLYMESVSDSVIRIPEFKSDGPLII